MVVIIKDGAAGAVEVFPQGAGQRVHSVDGAAPCAPRQPVQAGPPQAHSSFHSQTSWRRSASEGRRQGPAFSYNRWLDTYIRSTLSC